MRNQHDYFFKQVVPFAKKHNSHIPFFAVCVYIYVYICKNGKNKKKSSYIKMPMKQKRNPKRETCKPTRDP